MKARFNDLSVRSLDWGTKLIINLTHHNAQEAAKTNPVFHEVENQYAVFSPLVPKEHYTYMSESLKKMGRDITSDIQSIKKLATATAALFAGTEKADAAQTVLAAIKKGGKLYGEKSEELDTRTTAVVNEFATPNVKAALATLALTEAGDALQEKKTQYDAAWVTRLDKKSEISQTDTATSVRPRLEAALKDYLSLVTAMRKVAGWEDLYADLNEVTKRIKRSIREKKELEDIEPEMPQA